MTTKLDKDLFLTKHAAIYDPKFQERLYNAPWKDWLGKSGYFDVKDEYLETIEKLYAKEKLLFKNKFDFSLTKNSALMLFRFMRYKDEYEVARLHTSGEFANSFLNKNMKKNINFYLAPPLLNIRDKNTYPPDVKLHEKH